MKLLWRIQEAPVFSLVAICIAATGTFLAFFYAGNLAEMLAPLASSNQTIKSERLMSDPHHDHHPPQCRQKAVANTIGWMTDEQAKIFNLRVSHNSRPFLSRMSSTT